MEWLSVAWETGESYFFLPLSREKKRLNKSKKSVLSQEETQEKAKNHFSLSLSSEKRRDQGKSKIISFFSFCHSLVRNEETHENAKNHFICHSFVRSKSI